MSGVLAGSDLDRMLTAERIRQHQARIDAARDAGALLEEAATSRNGSVFPGYHLTPRGRVLGGEEPLEGPGEAI